MHFVPLENGAWLIDPEPKVDERGLFARGWCAREFAEKGLAAQFVQTNISWNRQRGTLRGLHFQSPPHAEAKLVRCVRGALFDVAVDLRPNSPTLRTWVGVELTAENRRALYVPEGFAHGFQTLRDDTELFYQISAFHAPECESGLRYDDPRLAIAWPLPVARISAKDATWPYLESDRPQVGSQGGCA